MCAPMIIPAMVAATPYILGATAAITAYTGYAGMQAQKKYQHSLAINAANDAANKNSLLSLRLSQEQEAAGAQISEAATRSRAARSAHNVAAGEAGVSGLSVDALEQNFFRQESLYRDRVMRNLEFKQQQFGFDVKGVEAQYLTAANASQRPLDLSWIGNTLSAAGGVGSYLQQTQATQGG